MRQDTLGRRRREAVVRATTGKTRITIRIDDDVIAWFKAQVRRAGGGSYQSLINDALRDYMHAREESLESTLRRVLREELPRDGVKRSRPATKPPKARR